MKHYFRRRTVLGLITSGILAACKPARSEPTPDQTKRTTKDKNVDQAFSADTIYQHGVASGDPAPDSVVIWTRISVASESRVNWQVSESPEFDRIVATGHVTTNDKIDFTIKAIASGLTPGTTYYYRFNTAGVVSPVGKTKTLPEGDVPHYGIALASCSNFAFGFFNAYDAIAKDPDVDLVLHTGDYIYEYGADGWGADTAKQLGRVHQPANEIISLADYRTRHAQYKTDKGSQAMHAMHPMICCWDDHESANNPWRNGAKNHQPDSEGNWSERLAASVQAYYEWMPIRDPGDPSARLAFSRAYKIGDLANLVTLETRHTARAEQIDYLKYVDKLKSTNDAQQFKQNIIGAKNRPMLSEHTEKLVTQTFSKSNNSQTPWRVLGNASPIARMLVPDIESLGTLEGERLEQLNSDAAKSLLWKGKYNLPFYTDTWDGYPWAREKFYQACQSVNATDLIFLTGDSHSFWMNQLYDVTGKAMGVELGTAGITSPGDFVESGWSRQASEKLDRVFEQQLKEIIWTDNFHQGYVRLELTPMTAKASFIAVSTVSEPIYTSKVIKQSYIKRSNGSLKFA